MIVRKRDFLAWGANGTLLVDGCGGSVLAAHILAHCNAVQNQAGFIRYPWGTIGVWSS